MPMLTIDIVQDLISQLNLFIELSATSNIASDSKSLVPSVSLRYSRTSFRLHDENNLFLEVVIDKDVKGSQAITCYCVEQDKTVAVKAQFMPLMLPVSKNLSENTAAVGCDDSTLTYLEIADSIARCGYQCANGDDYRPGYFSEILIDKEKIVLQQINHMNAKSLDHKKNYSLRELKLTIPLGTYVEKPLGFEEENIGSMRIILSDRSSENNKHCGREIQRKIEEERSSFKSTV